MEMKSRFWTAVSIFVVILALILLWSVVRGRLNIGLPSLPFLPGRGRVTPTLVPFPTFPPDLEGVITLPPRPQPTITYENLPFGPNDKTRRVELVGCVPNDSEWGLSYPKKIVEVANVANIESETMRAFLKQAGENGWGGFPSRQEVANYEQAIRKDNPDFNFKNSEVILKKLTIDSDGTVRVYFSEEVKAYGGGSTRVACLGDAVALTLKQFERVKDVVLCIEDECADQKGSTLFAP